MSGKYKSAVEKKAQEIVGNLTVSAAPSFDFDDKGQLFDELCRSLNVRFRNSPVTGEEIKQIAGVLVGEL